MSESPSPFGNYKCVAAYVNGQALDAPVVAEFRLTLSPTAYQTTRGDQVLFASTYSLDQSTTPWRIDIAGVGPFAGKTGEGICSFDGDRLKICHTMPGQPRPIDFVSDANNGAYLMEWIRIP